MSSEIFGYSLNVVIVVVSATIRDWLTEQLENFGHTINGTYANLTDFAAQSPKEVAAVPNVIITDQTDPSSTHSIKRTLGHRHIEAPIIIISDQPEELLKLQEETEMLIFGRDIFPLSPDQFQAALLVAIPLFHGAQSLKEKLASTTEELANQKKIGQAKDILCKVHDIDPKKANQMLKEMATSRQISTAEQAAYIIDHYAGLFPIKGKGRSKRKKQ